MSWVQGFLINSWPGRISGHQVNDFDVQSSEEDSSNSRLQSFYIPSDFYLAVNVWKQIEAEPSSNFVVISK